MISILLITCLLTWVSPLTAVCDAYFAELQTAPVHACHKAVSEMQDCSCGQDECFEGDDDCNCGSCPDETH